MLRLFRRRQEPRREWIVMTKPDWLGMKEWLCRSGTTPFLDKATLLTLEEAMDACEQATRLRGIPSGWAVVRHAVALEKSRPTVPGYEVLP